MLDVNFDLDNAITKEEFIDELYGFVNHILRKYNSREADNDACRVYVDGMIGCPRSFSVCPFIQIGNTGMMYRCKLGSEMPYNFKYKQSRPEGCKLRER